MVMLRPPGKPYEVAKKVLKTKGIKVSKPCVIERTKVKPPFPYR